MELNWKEHIHSDKDILMGKPVIKGTRISVEFILELFAKGWTEEMILNNYPTLKSEDIKAVFIFLADCLQEELFFPSPKKVA